MSRSKQGENTQDDICPVCKSNRYLNPSLQFLINPECYHKMCSTCVDRIFTSGPASCPVPHCGKTLRKKGFHKAFFADLKIEREVDIRRRVGKVFNRRQNEFEGLREWNDYLETVEDLVFDLVEGDKRTREKAEKTLQAYAEGNRGEIEENRRAAEEEAELGKLQEQAEREAVRERRLMALKVEQDEKADVAKMQREVLNRLASTDEDANKIAKQAQKIILKKSSARRNLAESTETAGGLTIRGLKKREAAVAEKPYDPFGGIHFAPTRYVLQDEYSNDYVSQLKRQQPSLVVGGYSFEEYYSRSMFEAFSGLAVFIEDEMSAQPPQVAPVVPSIAADVQASNPKFKLKFKVKQESDDIF